MQTEGPFWRNTVKPQFDKMGLFYKRIESPLSPGFLDTIVIYEGHVTLIELKTRDRLDKRFGLNPLQKIFFQKWNLEGGMAFILTLIGDHIYFLRPTIIQNDPTDVDLKRATVLSAPSREFPWQSLLFYFNHSL